MASRQLAEKFGISERTVRDIWSRRSRANITRPQWTPNEVNAGKTKQRIGRPPGAKDATPRKRTDRSPSEPETSSSDDGSRTARETSSSDGGTTRQSGNTESRSQTTGDSGENSNSSQQERQSSTSGRENSSSGSGDSSPQHQESTAPSASEQHARNERLKEAVLSLLGSDWRDSLTAKPARNNMSAPDEKQQLTSTAQTFPPTNMQDAVHSAPHLAQFGASSGLHQPFAGQWPSQNPPLSPCYDATYGNSMQAVLGHAQTQHDPELARQSPYLPSSSANAHLPQWQMPEWHVQAAAPPPQSFAQPYARSSTRDAAPTNAALNPPLMRAPSFVQDHTPPSIQHGFRLFDSASPAGVSRAQPVKLEMPSTSTLGSYCQPPPQPPIHPGYAQPARSFPFETFQPGTFDASYAPPHQPLPSPRRASHPDSTPASYQTHYQPSQPFQQHGQQQQPTMQQQQQYQSVQQQQQPMNHHPQYAQQQPLPPQNAPQSYYSLVPGHY